MNARERIAAVLALEAPDRVPVGPLLDHFAATYTGISNARLMNDPDARAAAVLQTMRELGPWDLTFLADTANAAILKRGIPLRIRLPGKELPENEIHQFEEIELLQPEDYDRVIELGFLPFTRDVLARLYPEERRGALRSAIGMFRGLRKARQARRLVERAGAELACSLFAPGPFIEYFSFGRSMETMALDLYDRPEKVKAAGLRWAETLTGFALRLVSAIGVPRVVLGLSRTSPAVISPKHFEEFVWPGLEIMVNGLIDAGVTPIFHCDTDWTPLFPVFRRFPAKKCILELDSHSNIFEAKKILGDRMCIMGDVPATLFAFGSKDAVLAYCRRLIEEVGKGGGFLLSSGCSIPANAKPENVRALVEAAEEWGWY